MDPATSLRPEQPEDAPFLLQLYASTRARELNPLPWDASQKEAFVRMQFDLQTRHYRQFYPDAAFLIVQLDGNPIGRIYVDRSEKQILLIDIALLPEHRGLGIGGRLLNELLSEAAAAQRPVHIQVERNNPALRLYERLGFKVIEDKGIHLFMEWLPSSRAAEK
jgi:ribosomal protein S18 acetylase RimI-like enzyme